MSWSAESVDECRSSIGGVVQSPRQDLHFSSILDVVEVNLDPSPSRPPEFPAGKSIAVADSFRGEQTTKLMIAISRETRKLGT